MRSPVGDSHQAFVTRAGPCGWSSPAGWPKLSSLYVRVIRDGVAHVDDPALLEDEAAIAEALDAAHVVRDEQDRAALRLHPVELVEALVLEGGVADRQHLVHEHDVRVDLDRDGKRQPHLHPGRVVLQLEVHELLELGELDDRVEARARLRASGRA